MNERIKQFAEQAGYKDSGATDIIGMELFLERFAQLIIRDSAKQVSNVYKQGGGNYGEVILKRYNLDVYE